MEGGKAPPPERAAVALRSRGETVQQEEEEEMAAEETRRWGPPLPVWGVGRPTTPVEREREGTSGVDCGRLVWETR